MCIRDRYNTCIGYFLKAYRHVISVSRVHGIGVPVLGVVYDPLFILGGDVCLFLHLAAVFKDAALQLLFEPAKAAVFRAYGTAAEMGGDVSHD